MTSRQLGSHRIPYRLVLVVTVLSSLCGRAFAAGGQATFEGLGFLEPNGFGPVIAYGISADGQTVVGESNSPQGFQAFRWTESTGIVGLGAFDNPGGLPSSSARACSADGSVIVGASSLPDSLDESGSPFRWTAQTGLVWLGSLGGPSGGVARGVSSDGSVVVGYGRDANLDVEAFRWTSAGIVGLGDLPGGVVNSQASAVSGVGARVIGLATTGSVYNTSFQWTAANGLGQMQPTDFRTIGISRDGVFAAGIRFGRAARVNIDTGGVTMLPHVAIPGLNTDTDTAWAASSDGSVVVGMENLSQGNGFFGRAFLWDQQHGTRILLDVLVDDFGLGGQLAGWELNAATCVSDDGRTLAGYGFAPSGEQAAWRATLPADDLPGAPICLGDGSRAPCPCNNTGSTGHGCNNFGAFSGGAVLTTSGNASLSADTIVLLATGENITSLTVFWTGKGPVSPTGVAHGAGLRCITSTLKRLYVGSASGGVISRPGGGDPSVSARTAAVGSPITAGETRYYFTIYRDPQAATPCGNSSSTVNLSSAMGALWTP